MITLSKTKSFTQDHRHPQRHIRHHASLLYPPLWQVSSNHPISYSSLLTPTIIPQRMNGTLSASFLRIALLYLHHASRTAASLWNFSPSITMTFGTMPQISISGCNTTTPAILPPLPLTPQSTSSNLPTRLRPMLSVMVWSHSATGSISHTATLSSTDLLTLLSLELAKQVIASVKLTGTSYPKISPSIAIHRHASTSHPIPFMLIRTFMSPI